jgi:hypothetical protein
MVIQPKPRLVTWKVKVKVKVTPQHALGNTDRESKVTTPLIHTVATRWRLVFNFTHRPIYPRKETLVPIQYEAEWAPEKVWAFWKREKMLLPVWIPTLECPALT